MRTRVSDILAWGALTSYVLVTLAVHALHDHEHLHGQVEPAFVSADSSSCHVAAHESACGGCSHDHDHSPHDHHHEEDDCAFCQFLAVKILSVAKIAVPVAGDFVSAAPLPVVSLPDAPGPSLPNSRGPPRSV